MLADVFWSLATINVVLSIGFTVWAIARRRLNKPALSFEISRGQRQDIWLSVAIIWGVLLAQGWAEQWLLYLAGAASLLWLTCRTIQRVQFF